MNGPILKGLGFLLIAAAVFGAITGEFVLAAILAAFGGAAVVWGAKTAKDRR